MAKLPDLSECPKGWRWLMQLLHLYLTRRNRRRVLKIDKERIPAMESAIATAKAQYAKAEANGLTHAMQIYNAGLYLVLMDRDVAVIRLDMVSTLESWRLKTYARQLALLLYEACDDIPVMLGKDFRRTLEIVAKGKNFAADLDVIMKRLNGFKKQHEKSLHHLRNMIAGHRDKNAILFLNEVDQLDPLHIMGLTAEVFKIVGELIDFLTKVMLEMSTFHNVLAQVAAASNSRTTGTK